MQIHERVLHVLPDSGDQVYVIHEQALEEVLTDISPVGKKLSEEALRKLPVFQRFAIIAVPGRKLPLDDFRLVIDDYMEVRLQ